MTPSEAAKLLTLCAAYDNRKPDTDTARAWTLVLDGVRFEDAQQAVVAHYQQSREWLMPADIVAGVKKMREDRWGTYCRRHGYLTPPARFADDPAAESAWWAEAHEQIRSGDVTEPSQLGGYESGELRQRDVSTLGELGQPVPRSDYARQAAETRARLREHLTTSAATADANTESAEAREEVQA